MRARASITVACAALLLLAGCSTPPPVHGPAPSQSAPAPSGDGVLRIGTLFPASGQASFIGPAQSAGVQLAVNDINAAGGALGKPVELVQRDSGEAAGGTLEASFADLQAAGVDAIVGPSSSVLAQRAIPLAVAASIPLISPAATYPGLSEAADAGLFLRTIPAYGQQGLALAKAISQQGPVSVAYLYVDDELGRAILPTLTAGIEAAGSTLALAQPIDAAGADIPAAIAALTAAAPDALVLGSSYASVDTTKALISAALGAGFGGAKLWLTTQNTGDYSQAFPNGTLAGVNGIIEGYHPDDVFIGRLKQIDGALTDVRYAAEAYDATILIALAATVAADDGGASIASRLRDVSVGGIKCTSYAECIAVFATQPDLDYDGVSGSANFTAQGDIARGFYGIYAYDGENRFAFQRGVIAG